MMIVNLNGIIVSRDFSPEICSTAHQVKYHVTFHQRYVAPHPKCCSNYNIQILY